MAVVNLLAQMTSLLQSELEGQDSLPDENAVLNHGSSSDPLDSMMARESKTPCLDLLLSDNILSHVLATSRMPVSLVYNLLFLSVFIQNSKNFGESFIEL